ncbi:N-acetylglucosamine-6-phosphate deacetylase [Aquibacillus albus]|uniref:N-acetylglucosamine-6-phosphate deacetylase n=1 Tax=Aquibacillus albus TaxID=1168171 RepID=A0ABS2MZH8_9BACI|nr:N-acetylglucosamine-6-phosphate deacetylase [Aquibacillus albus]MBM7571314.1 N-acetylglucosamine-6-phosphate deacetylase [Aquibacillus albus]
MTEKNTLLKNATLYTESGVIENGYIKLVDHHISDVGSMENLTAEDDFNTFNLPDDYKIIPGMIDVHIHGVNGADTMDATPEALKTMAKTLPREGTTSFLATTMTQNRDAIEKALLNAGKFITDEQEPGYAEIIGIHLEGPFINKERAGAQPIEHITDPNLELFKKWQTIAQHTIKLVTLAPEQPGATELIQHLKTHNVIASIGHSDATFEQVELAIQEGLSHVTHLYNQMRGLHHREPGVVGAALLKEELMVEIISDGIHSRPEAVQLAFQAKKADRLVLITDAMRAKCLKSGTYDLGGQKVTVEDDRAFLEDGTLAGSVLTMDQAFKNMIEFSGCSIPEAIAMSSTNPAKELGLCNKKGSIAIGKDADVVVLDEENKVAMTFCKGYLAFQKGDEKE